MLGNSGIIGTYIPSSSSQDFAWNFDAIGGGSIQSMSLSDKIGSDQICFWGIEIAIGEKEAVPVTYLGSSLL